MGVFNYTLLKDLIIKYFLSLNITGIFVFILLDTVCVLTPKNFAQSFIESNNLKPIYSESLSSTDVFTLPE
jgi:hypothetical protein